MTRQLRWLPAAIGVAAMIGAGPIDCAYAGRGGGFSRGGFSRGGPAEAGSFASRSGGMAAARGGEANRVEQANRTEYGEHAQASRQEEMNALQSNREQAAKALQSNAPQYRGGYPYRGVGYPAWDAGAPGMAAVATGAAIGAAAAAAPMAATPGTGAYTGGQPCANAAPVSVGSDTLYQCGSAWYREAYGPSGPVFIAVRPPGGY
jgi:hypothetical protein